MVSVLASLALLAGVAVRLTGLDHAGMSFCFFKALTGYACLTCGTTRALGHLSRFDLTPAFTVQPLVTTGILAVLLWGAADLLLALASKRTVVHLRGGAPRAVLVVAVVLVSLNWIYLLATGV